MTYIKIQNFLIIPQRIILSIMGFLALVNAYTMRVCLSVAITEMAIKQNFTNTKHNLSVCKYDDEYSIKVIDAKMYSDSEKLFNWSEELQGTILSSFFWGYVVAHLPGGLVADKFGGKWTLSFGILFTSLCTLLTPIAIIHGGSTALIILRSLIGLGQGTTFPALSVLISNWIPLKERSILGAFVFGGGEVGAVFGTAFSGLLLNYFSKWEPVFYFWGTLGVIWFFIFTIICYNDPLSHPFIKDSEKDYLKKEMGQLERPHNLPPTPWKAIFTSLPIFALIIAQIGHDWGFYIMVTDLPKYMSEILLFPIKENGLYSSIPYIVMWVNSILCGFICDWMITNNYMSITNSRKLWTITAAIGPAIFLVAASYAGCDKILVIIFFTICMGLMGPWYAGMKINPLDLSPNYAGTIMAISNGIGAIGGILVPIFIGTMTPDATLEEWRLVFWVGFIILSLSGIIYGIWASGEVQPWNNPIENKIIDERYQKNKFVY